MTDTKEPKRHEIKTDLLAGVYVVWVNHGYEGWSPTSCADLAGVVEAIKQSYGSEHIVTRPVNFTAALGRLERFLAEPDDIDGKGASGGSSR